ncbi:hypothetical protein [Saccharopolyspora gregorii]|uniref:hypothetical protein n=1 Tax=Saccharopolyspora gregorii TaxID=33914 RepID=UPI0021AD0CA8|nr:hypothetical protein [Saccharopolyspora gregorii]
MSIEVSDEGEVLSVALAADWKRRVDPRRLSTHVVAAANEATLRAATVQAERTPVDTPASAARSAEEAGGIAASDDPITKDDAMQLISAVSADLDAFQQRLGATVGSTASAESSGGHVRGTARQGQLLELVVDATWCSSARNAEIEGELAQTLESLRHRTSPPELAGGPDSPAISQLFALASDPQRLLRRLGLVTEERKGEL